MMRLKCIFAMILCTAINIVASYDIQVSMPGVIPEYDDAYLCSAFPIPDPERLSYIKSYESTTNQSVAHHILLYGCQKPFSSESYYPCSHICDDGKDKILFAWGKDAKKFEYPENTGMAVSGDTGVRYFVLQVHYLKKMTSKDTSGMKIQLTYQRPTYLVSIGLLFSGHGKIPANSRHVNMDISCKYTGKVPVYVLAFRTHAHGLGRSISGFRVSHRNGQIELIGKGNPQWPQTFYKANSDVTIMPGDVLMARCVFDSMGRDRVTYIGGTHHDEMCNFYMMLISKTDDGNLGFEVCGDNEYVDLWENIPEYSQKYSALNPSPDILLESKTIRKLTFNSQWKVQVSIGEVCGVAIFPKSVHRSTYSLLVLHRGDRQWTENTFKDNIYIGDKTHIPSDVILEVNPMTGKVLRKAGANIFVLPHGITVTKDGKYVWIADVALHQVMRFALHNNQDPELMSVKPDVVFGERFVLGNDKSHFCKPSKVAVDSKGFIFVADGYCNSRVVCFYPNGTYADEWRANENMLIVHSISIEEDESGDSDKNMVWVADRNNRRIIAFKYDGKVAFISPETPYGLPIYAIEFNPVNRFLYGVSSNGFSEGNSFLLNYKMNNFMKPWHSNYSMKAPHDLCLAEDGDVVFVAELNLRAVIKFSNVYHPDKTLQVEVENVSERGKFVSKVNPIIILTILCIMFCLLLIYLCGRYSKREKKIKRHYPKSKDREGFQPLTQNDDTDHKCDSDPEAEEFTVHSTRISRKPKV